MPDDERWLEEILEEMVSNGELEDIDLSAFDNELTAEDGDKAAVGAGDAPQTAEDLNVEEDDDDRD